MKLIIAEKTSVAKSIASALGASSRADGFYEGNELLVSWCVGHLVSPMDAGGYDERFKKWRYDDLPILPEPFRYVLAPGKEDAFENLRALMDRSDVDTIVNACDAGREGELIFRLMYEMAGCRKPVLRLWISSMEDSAIREGFSDLRPGADYEALYQSALCRQKADWLVGINATRLFSVLYHRTLNVGRVQTPTLAMLAERDAKITLFHKEKYHLLRLTLDGTEAVSEKFTDPAEAEQAAVCLLYTSGSTKRSLTWQKRDTLFSHSYFRLAASAHGMSASELLSSRLMFPTPLASDKNTCRDAANLDVYLSDNGIFRKVNKSGAIWSLSLSAAVFYLTPAASEGYRSTLKPAAFRSSAPSANLSAQVIRQERPLSETAALNPDWVEWLMGFPRKWTDVSSGPPSRRESPVSPKTPRTAPYG